jgi:glucuronokinase
MDETFDQRASVMALDPVHVEMIDVARAAGASANYTGSGGAVVVLAADGRAREALTGLGCDILEL